MCKPDITRVQSATEWTAERLPTSMGRDSGRNSCLWQALEVFGASGVRTCSTGSDIVIANTFVEFLINICRNSGLA